MPLNKLPWTGTNGASEIGWQAVILKASLGSWSICIWNKIQNVKQRNLFTIEVIRTTSHNEQFHILLNIFQLFNISLLFSNTKINKIVTGEPLTTWFHEFSIPNFEFSWSSSNEIIIVCVSKSSKILIVLMKKTRLF